MKIKDALDWVRENNFFGDGEQSLIGIVHSPDEHPAKFNTIALSLNQEDKEELGIDTFNAYLSGGLLSTTSGEEDYYSDETIEGLIEQLPDFVNEMKFKVYPVDGSVIDAMPELILSTIFPDLPSLEDEDDPRLEKFKAAAIEKLNALNS